MVVLWHKIITGGVKLMMKLVSKVVSPVVLLAGPTLSSGTVFPHTQTIPAEIDGLQRIEPEVAQPERSPELRAWLSRFGHIASLRALNHLARELFAARPEYPQTGKGPVGSEINQKRQNNTFGRSR